MNKMGRSQAVYTVLREAEYRSTAFVPYWRIPLARSVVPRQQRCTAALATINTTLDGLVAKCRTMVNPLSDWLVFNTCLPIALL